MKTFLHHLGVSIPNYRYLHSCRYQYSGWTRAKKLLLFSITREYVNNIPKRAVKYESYIKELTTVIVIEKEPIVTEEQAIVIEEEPIAVKISEDVKNIDIVLENDKPSLANLILSKLFWWLK